MKKGASSRRKTISRSDLESFLTDISEETPIKQQNVSENIPVTKNAECHRETAVTNTNNENTLNGVIATAPRKETIGVLGTRLQVKHSIETVPSVVVPGQLTNEKVEAEAKPEAATAPAEDQQEPLPEFNIATAVRLLCKEHFRDSTTTDAISLSKKSATQIAVGKAILQETDYFILPDRTLYPEHHYEQQQPAGADATPRMADPDSYETKRALILSLTPVLQRAEVDRREEVEATERFTGCKAVKLRSASRAVAAAAAAALDVTAGAAFVYQDTEHMEVIQFQEYERRYLLYLQFCKEQRERSGDGGSETTEATVSPAATNPLTAISKSSKLQAPVAVPRQIDASVAPTPVPTPTSAPIAAAPKEQVSPSAAPNSSSLSFSGSAFQSPAKRVTIAVDSTSSSSSSGSSSSGSGSKFSSRTMRSAEKYRQQFLRSPIAACTRTPEEAKAAAALGALVQVSTASPVNASPTSSLSPTCDTSLVSRGATLCSSTDDLAWSPRQRSPGSGAVRVDGCSMADGGGEIDICIDLDYRCDRSNASPLLASSPTDPLSSVSSSNRSVLNRRDTLSPSSSRQMLLSCCDDDDNEVNAVETLPEGPECARAAGTAIMDDDGSTDNDEEDHARTYGVIVNRRRSSVSSNISSNGRNKRKDPQSQQQPQHSAVTGGVPSLFDVQESRTDHLLSSIGADDVDEEPQLLQSVEQQSLGDVDDEGESEITDAEASAASAETEALLAAAVAAQSAASANGDAATEDSTMSPGDVDGDSTHPCRKRSREVRTTPRVIADTVSDYSSNGDGLVEDQMMFMMPLTPAGQRNNKTDRSDLGNNRPASSSGAASSTSATAEETSMSITPSTAILSPSTSCAFDLSSPSPGELRSSRHHLNTSLCRRRGSLDTEGGIEEIWRCVAEEGEGEDRDHDGCEDTTNVASVDATNSTDQATTVTVEDASAHVDCNDADDAEMVLHSSSTAAAAVEGTVEASTKIATATSAAIPSGGDGPTPVDGLWEACQELSESVQRNITTPLPTPPKSADLQDIIDEDRLTPAPTISISTPQRSPVVATAAVVVAATSPTGAVAAPPFLGPFTPISGSNVCTSQTRVYNRNGNTRVTACKNSNESVTESPVVPEKVGTNASSKMEEETSQQSPRPSAQTLATATPTVRAAVVNSIGAAVIAAATGAPVGSAEEKAKSRYLVRMEVCRWKYHWEVVSAAAARAAANRFQADTCTL